MTLKRIKLFEDSIMRKRRRRKRIERVHHMRRKKKSNYFKKNSSCNVNAPYEAVAPIDFSVNNIERVISFLSDVDRNCRQSRAKILKVNLNYVEKIDSYSISLLLSLLNRLSCKNIRYWGTYPDNPVCKQFIIDSGFLDMMKTNIKRPSNKNTGNQMFMVGKESVDSKRIGKAVRESMVHIIGKEDIYPPLYDDLLEFSANSVEHANVVSIEKNWLVSITQDNNKLHFILTDTGLGILTTIKKKTAQQWKDAILRNEAEVLRDVFLKLYQSITGEINRHKGLPIIYESFTEGYISDLKVLTNNVFYNFVDDTYQILKKGFKGVLFSWTITKENYNNWLNSLDY